MERAKGGTLKRLGPTIIAILLLACIHPSGFAEESSDKPPKEGSTTQKEDDRLPIHKQDQWQFFVSPYLWVPGFNVNTTISDHTTSASRGWWDIIPKLFSSAIGGMGRFEAWKGKWGFFIDSYFIYLGGNVSDSAGKTVNLGPRGRIPLTVILNGNLKYITRAGNVDFGPRYLLGTVNLSADKPLPVLSFEVLGGGRFNAYSQYLKLNLDATLTGPLQTRTAGGSFVSKYERYLIEPMLGMRLSLWLTTKAVITYRGTVGGFGLAADNNLDSDMELACGYKVHKNIYAYVGYRARFESASNNDNSVEGWFHGPILGTVFTF
ncbi:MAG: hypothetical protein ACOZF2_06885 [Thermodesulfobacteriota bacterium]